MNNWEKKFHRNRLKRGYQYYHDNRVVYLKKVNDMYFSLVKGAGKKYHVTVILKDNQIDIMECNCKDFEKGHRCKHIAATLYAIENKDYRQDNHGNEDINEVIDSLSNSEIKSYFKNIIQEFDLISRFKLDYLDYFDDSGLKDDIIDFYNQYDNIARSKYYGSFKKRDFIIEVKRFNYKINYLITRQRYQEAFSCLIAGIDGLKRTEIVKSFIYDLYLEYLDILKQIAKNNKTVIKDNMLSLLEVIDDILDRELFYQFLYSSDIDNQMLIDFFKKQIDLGFDDHYYLKTCFNYYQSLSLSKLKDFAYKYCQYSIIQDLFLDYLDNQENYLEMALFLKQLPIDNQYEQIINQRKIISCYQKAKADDYAIKECLDLLYNHGKLADFRLLKKLYGNNFDEVRNQVIETLEDLEFDIVKFLREENMIDELFFEVKHSFKLCYENRDLLKDKYSNELTNITIDYIDYLSPNVYDQLQINYLIRIIKSLNEYHRPGIIKEIVAGLIEKYPNRPLLVKRLEAIAT